MFRQGLHVVGVSGLGGDQDGFVPTPAPRGLKATEVVPGVVPAVIFLEPGRFVWSRNGAPKGMDIVLETGSGWSEDNDPNEARTKLIEVARQYGANGVVNVQLEKYTQHDGGSNYQYTVRRFSGDFVILKQVRRSTDPARISRSRRDMQAVQAWWEKRNASNPNDSDQVLPDASWGMLIPKGIKYALSGVWRWVKTTG
ncbi:hypothetical protein ACCD10_25425 [Pseudomonas sp. Pseusp122]|uniref:hypothetical protein n=1 Tax=unclassified Pseudomonas TaxID=196821 RepID=UPI0039A51C97